MDSPTSGGGCGKPLLGCGAIILVAILALVIGGYVAFYHSALPARAIVALLNESPDVQIEGVSGSISSGFAVESIHLTDENGNVNELIDARLRYDQTDEAFVITEIHLGSAHLFVDFSDSGAGSSTESEPHADHDDTPGAGEGESLNLIIQKGSINDVKLEDVKTGEVFHLKSVQLDNLHMVNGSFKMDRFVVDSSTCKLKVLPEAGKENAYTVEGRFEKDFHERVLEPIAVSGGMHVKGKNEFTLDLKALGGSIAVTQKDQHTDIIKIRDLNPAKYISKLPPISKLIVDFSTTEKDASIEGSLLFGDKPFAIKQKVTKAEAETEPPLIARHESGGVKYELQFSSAGKSNQMFDMALVTQPNMPLKKALSQLLFDKAPGALSAEQQKQLESAAHHFKK